MPDTGASDPAVERYARLFLAAERQSIDGGAVAPTQRRELATAASALDAMRVNGAEDLRVVLDREPGALGNRQSDPARLTEAWLREGQLRADPGACGERFVADWKALTADGMAATTRRDEAIVERRQARLEARMSREPALDRAMPERQLRIDQPESGGQGVSVISAWRCSAMETAGMFATRSDFAGIASTRVHRPTKTFEAALDRLFGERVRDDGACGVDLWCALAGVEWRNQQGETLCYSHRTAGDVVAWVREEGSYLDWYASGEPGEVADWIGDALADAGWSWSMPQRDRVRTGVNPDASPSRLDPRASVDPR